MWDTVEVNETPISHDLPCAGCGHAGHTYLPCSDSCQCTYDRDRLLVSAR